MACRGLDPKLQEKDADEEKPKAEEEEEEEMASSESEGELSANAFRNMLHSLGKPDDVVISCGCRSLAKKYREKRPIRILGEKKRKYEKMKEGDKFKFRVKDKFRVEDDDSEGRLWYNYDRFSSRCFPPDEEVIYYANLAIDSYNKDNSMDYRLVELVKANAYLVTVVKGLYYRMAFEVKLPDQDAFDAITLYAEVCAGALDEPKVELVCEADDDDDEH